MGTHATPHGYTLGTLGALIILVLLWLGVRKRQYLDAQGSLIGWLSAHVYLGLGLAVIVTLHSGFQLGWNVHSLAYVLMLAVIASGLYGGTWRRRAWRTRRARCSSPAPTATSRTRPACASSRCP